MAWKTINRIKEPAADGPPLSPALKEKIRSFFSRYETKRAAILPALHMVQDDLGQLSWPAMREVAELLEIPASDVFDTVSFYTHFWTTRRGEKVVMVCRSVSCEVMGANEVLAECKRVLGIDEHQTTPDGKYSLVTEECLAACDHAPCLYVNEKCHKKVKPDDVRRILEDEDNDKLDIPRSNLYDGVGDRDEPVAAAASVEDEQPKDQQDEDA
jgi:NADH:ubiquinone oxidoreductase subunit E